MQTHTRQDETCFLQLTGFYIRTSAVVNLRHCAGYMLTDGNAVEDHQLDTLGAKCIFTAADGISSKK